MASSKTESNITNQKIQRSISISISPSGSFCSSSSSSFSPNRNSVDRNGNSFSSSPSVRFSIDHHRNGNSSDQNQNQISSNHRSSSNGQNKKKKCMCSPTTHPGSFRCSLHRNVVNQSNNAAVSVSISYQSSHRSCANARRSAISNSIARVGTADGDLVKRSLASLMIRPSSHQQKRRGEFQPKPSRLSVMSKADM